MYVCQKIECRAPIALKQAQVFWWRTKDRPSGGIICSRCMVRLNVDWASRFNTLFECPWESQRLLRNSIVACAIYAQAAKAMCKHHVQKLEMAEQILKRIVPQINDNSTNVEVINQLAIIAKEYAYGLADEYGKFSLEYAAGCTYFLDLLAHQKNRSIQTNTGADVMPDICAALEHALAVNISPIFIKYIAEFVTPPTNTG